MAVKKFTKEDIVDSIHQKTGINRKDIRAVLNLFTGEIKDALVKQIPVELRGFGTFEVRIRKARERARNPRTGTLVRVNSHGAAFFRPGQELKREVWNLNRKDAAPEPAPLADPPPVTLGEEPSRPSGLPGNGGLP